MKRALLAFALVAALAAAGWIFRVQKTVEPVYAGTIAGDAQVAVRFEPGAAEDAAARAAAAYRDAGWQELPVSTPTFRLFARGRRTAALLAEDAPSGARVTEFRRGPEP
ncbi:MAG: hypothetical protein ACI4RA_07535 [Kiritimatiellia bacterium]